MQANNLGDINAVTWTLIRPLDANYCAAVTASRHKSAPTNHSTAFSIYQPTKFIQDEMGNFVRRDFVGRF